jgi:hypothetical protein
MYDADEAYLGPGTPKLPGTNTRRSNNNIRILVILRADFDVVKNDCCELGGWQSNLLNMVNRVSITILRIVGVEEKNMKKHNSIRII